MKRRDNASSLAMTRGVAQPFAAHDDPTPGSEWDEHDRACLERDPLTADVEVAITGKAGEEDVQRLVDMLGDRFASVENHEVDM